MKPMTTAEMITWMDAQAEDHRKKSAWETIPAYKQEHADKADRYAAIARRMRLLAEVAEAARGKVTDSGYTMTTVGPEGLSVRTIEYVRARQALDADEREGGSNGTK
jgi:hypothetical protein